MLKVFFSLEWLVGGGGAGWGPFLGELFLGLRCGLASGEAAALLELRRAGEAAVGRPFLPPEAATGGAGGGLSAGTRLRLCCGWPQVAAECSSCCAEVAPAAPPDDEVAADPPLLHALLGCSAIEARLAPACTQHYTIHTWAATNKIQSLKIIKNVFI